MNDSNSVIAVSDLCKRYGSTQAVDRVSFAIEKGSIFGLLGTNGAGKTTAFKAILGLVFADSGTVRFNSEPLRPELFERMSYVPERCVLYEWMTGRDHLELTKRSFRRFDAARAQALVDLFSLDVGKRVKQMSKGQQSAMALTLAFSTYPQILVLDEPASGLDPVHQRHVLDLMFDAAAGGATILFSSHQIGQVERAADHVAIMHRGKIVLTGDVEALRAGEKVVEAVFADAAPRIDGLESDPHVRRVMRQGRILRAFVRSGGNGIASRIAAENPTSLRILDQNLEDIFLAAVGDHTDAAPGAVREA
jgi:ABC-2 type transport system ATP-binding protein